MYSQFSSLDSDQQNSFSEHQSTLIPHKISEKQVNKSSFSQKGSPPKSSKIRGFYCPKTNTFFSAEQAVKPQRRQRRTSNSEFWEVFDDILHEYQNPGKLNIELKQII